MVQDGDSCTLSKHLGSSWHFLWPVRNQEEAQYLDHCRTTTTTHDEHLKNAGIDLPGFTEVSAAMPSMLLGDTRLVVEIILQRLQMEPLEVSQGTQR